VLKTSFVLKELFINDVTLKMRLLAPFPLCAHWSIVILKNSDNQACFGKVLTQFFGDVSFES